MAIPEILAYRMPTESELPRNQVTWRPDPDRAALLIHDMQRYFVDFFPAGEPVNTLVENIRTIRRQAHEYAMPVFYTAQPGNMTPQQRGLLRDFWGPGMSAEPANRRIVDALTPHDRDTVLTKWRYSAFHRTDLRARLAAAGRDQLIICGVYAHVGCLMTACDSFAQDIQPFLVGDAVADFTDADHRLALDYAARRCAAVLSTRAVSASLATAGLESVR